MTRAGQNGKDSRHGGTSCGAEIIAGLVGLMVGLVVWWTGFFAREREKPVVEVAVSGSFRARALLSLEPEDFQNRDNKGLDCTGT